VLAVRRLVVLDRKVLTRFFLLSLQQVVAVVRLRRVATRLQDRQAAGRVVAAQITQAAQARLIKVSRAVLLHQILTRLVAVAVRAV
jgi:hypothetical protein